MSEELNEDNLLEGILAAAQSRHDAVEIVRDCLLAYYNPTEKAEEIVDALIAADLLCIRKPHFWLTAPEDGNDW